VHISENRLPGRGEYWQRRKVSKGTREKGKNDRKRKEGERRRETLS
jgi:hypothetical protein